MLKLHSIYCIAVLAWGCKCLIAYPLATPLISLHVETELCKESTSLSEDKGHLHFFLKL